MEEQAAEMNDEWEVHHDLLQNQDNFDPAAGEGEAGGPTEDAVAPAGTAQDAAPTTSATANWPDPGSAQFFSSGQSRGASGVKPRSCLLGLLVRVDMVTCCESL